MKIGVTYLYTIFRYGYPPDPEGDFRALKELSDMGFHYMEMEGLGSDHSEKISKRREEFKNRLDGYGIHIHNFCCVDPDLVSLNDAKRREAYERFKRTAELGVYLGTETLHLASYAPPIEYIGKAPYQLDEVYSFANAFRVKIPDGFC